MATFARYTVIRDSVFTLGEDIPPTNSNGPDFHAPFDAPDVDRSRPSVLMLRVSGRVDNGSARLKVDLNGVRVLCILLETDVDRSVHEVISTGTLLTSQSNALEMFSDGIVAVSDIVVMYTATVPSGASGGPLDPPNAPNE